MLLVLQRFMNTEAVNNKIPAEFLICLAVIIDLVI